MSRDVELYKASKAASWSARLASGPALADGEVGREAGGDPSDILICYCVRSHASGFTFVSISNFFITKNY
jgi:hypothetical protein